MTDKIRFHLLKPFSVKGNYKVVEKPIMEKLKETFFGKPRKLSEEEELGRRKRSSMPLIYLLAFIIVAGLLGSYIMSFADQLKMLMNAPVFTPTVSMKINSVLLSDYGNIYSKNYNIVNNFNLNSSNANVRTLTIKTTDAPISKDIYMITEPSYASARMDDFAFEFASNARKIGLNPIIMRNVFDISKISDGSIVLVPTGYPPDGLLEQYEKNRGRRIILVYVGILPESKILSTGGYAPLASFWKSIGVTFQTPNAIPKTLDYMRNPLYTANNADLAYGAVSIVSPKDSLWSFVFIPNSIDNGWEDGSSAAKDVLKVVSSYDKWASYSSTAVYDSPNTTRSFFYGSEKFSGSPHVFELITFEGSSAAGKATVMDIRSAIKDFKGTLYLQEKEGPSILAYSISNQNSNFELLSVGTTSQIVDTGMKMVAMSDNSTVDDVFTVNEVSLNSPIYFQYLNPRLRPYPYIFEVFGNERYARTYIEYGTLEVKIKPDFNNAKFSFSFYSQGKPTEVQSGKITFRDKVFTFNGSRSTYELNLFDYFGSSAPVGSYNFTVEAGKAKVVSTVVRPETTGIGRLASPLNIMMVVVAVLIYVGGMFFKKNDDVMYGLDVPDFPSIDAIKIPLNSSVFVNMIEEINEFYKWTYTPVSIQDIKRQLSTLYFKGNRIYANDFNIEYIMDILKKKGYIKEELDFYGLVSWEKDSGFTIKQLSMFRKLRDICIDNTIPFSEIGRTRGYHVELKLMWNSFFIYFYEPKELKYIKDNFRKLVKDGLVFVVVEDEVSKREFLDSISDGGSLSSTLKFYIDSGDVILTTMDELEKKLKQMKG